MTFTTHWWTNEPDNSSPGEDCAMMHAAPEYGPGNFGDAHCDNSILGYTIQNSIWVAHWNIACYICQKDIDECTSLQHKCLSTATCVNKAHWDWTPVHGRGYECNCNSGYEGDGITTCSDIDECANNSHTCSDIAHCSNREGGYVCICNAGYSGFGNNCSDDDECELGTHDCGPNATCTNTMGSYSCGCDQGYWGDGYTCLWTTTEPYTTVHTSGTPTTTESPIAITFECNIPTNDGRCVSLNCGDSASYTWHDAKAACEDHGAYMATISHFDQNLQVSSVSQGRVWLGVTDEADEGTVDNSNL